MGLAEPLIQGRTPSPWLMKVVNQISSADFYNEHLSEDDLKRKYTDEVLSNPRRIELKEFKEHCRSLVFMGIKLADNVDDQLRCMACEMLDEQGKLRPS